MTFKIFFKVLIYNEKMQESTTLFFKNISPSFLKAHPYTHQKNNFVFILSKMTFVLQLSVIFFKNTKDLSVAYFICLNFILYCLLKNVRKLI